MYIDHLFELVEIKRIGDKKKLDLINLTKTIYNESINRNSFFYQLPSEINRKRRKF